METNLLKLIGKFNFQGVSFVSLKGYKSDKSDQTEIADILINVGISYENMKKSDLKTLLEAKENINQLVTVDFDFDTVKIAIDEKIQSILKPNENRSLAQTDAYITLNNGIKYSESTNTFKIVGCVVSKNIIQKGIYKTVNSSKKTLAKKYIDKTLNLKLSKFRYYTLNNIDMINVQKDTFIIT